MQVLFHIPYEAGPFCPWARCGVGLEGAHGKQAWRVSRPSTVSAGWGSGGWLGCTAQGSVSRWAGVGSVCVGPPRLAIYLLRAWRPSYLRAPCRGCGRMVMDVCDSPLSPVAISRFRPAENGRPTIRRWLARGPRPFTRTFSLSRARARSSMRVEMMSALLARPTEH